MKFQSNMENNKKVGNKMEEDTGKQKNYLKDYKKNKD